MKIPEGSGCAECANCLIVGDRTEYLCDDDNRAAGEDCHRFVSRDSEPPSRIYGISTAVAGADTETVDLEFIVEGQSRDDWFSFLKRESPVFQMTDRHYRVTLERIDGRAGQ